MPDLHKPFCFYMSKIENINDADKHPMSWLGTLFIMFPGGWVQALKVVLLILKYFGFSFACHNPTTQTLLYRIVWIKTSHQLVNYVLRWSVQAEWLSLIITSRLLGKDLVDFTTVQTPDWIFANLWRTADSALESIRILVWSVWGENQCDIREPILWPPQ